MSQIGSSIIYNGKEWWIVAAGEWGVRLQRGYGRDQSTIILTWDQLSQR